MEAEEGITGRGCDVVEDGISIVFTNRQPQRTVQVRLDNTTNTAIISIDGPNLKALKSE